MEKSEIEKRIAELEAQLKETPAVENKDGLDEKDLLDKLTNQAALLIEKRDKANRTTETVEKTKIETEETYQTGDVIDLTNEEFKKIDSEEADSEKWQHNEPEGEENDLEEEPAESEEVKKTRRGIFAWFKRKEKDSAPLLSEEEIAKLRLEAQESEYKKSVIREEILDKLSDAKRGEIKTNSFYRKVNKGLDWWENWGKKETDQGWNGFPKRILKTAVNLALIGAISFISVDQAARMGYGTASALGSNALPYLWKKIVLGLGLSALTEMTGGKKISPKTKKIISCTLLAGGLGAGAALTGGLAVPLAAGAGILVSKLLKKVYSEYKITEARKDKIDKIIKKYKSENLEGDLEKIENEITEKIGRWEERRKFWGKVLRGAAALGTSIAVLEASGFAHDAHDAHTTQDSHDQENDLGNQEGEKPVVDKPDDGTQPEETNPENSTSEHSFEKESIVFEKGAGGIKGIQQLQEQIKAEYPDLSKAPTGVQEFMKEDPTQMAIKLGFFKPGEEAESLSVFKGSTLGFDDHGNLSYHDIKTGEDHLLIDNQGETHAYGGRMFDSAPIQENSEINNDLENQQVNPITGEPMTYENIDHSDLINQQVNPITGEAINLPENLNHDLINQQIDPVTGEPVHTQAIDHNQGAENTGTNTETNANEDIVVSKENPYGLSAENLTKANQIYENKINTIFPNKESMEAWEKIANSTNTRAEILAKMNPDEVLPAYKPLVLEMHKLQELTGLNPIEKNLINIGETPKEYLLRATQKAVLDGTIK